MDDDLYDDDFDFDFNDEDVDPENMCDCGDWATDVCTLCGNPMCHMHFELKGGVCDRHG